MSPPLGLLVLGALTPREHVVEAVDENVRGCRHDDKPDLVGITVKVDTVSRSSAIAAHYRARGVPVVMGGIHASACPEDCLPHADAVVIGEADVLWSRLLQDVTRGRLQRLYRNTTRVDIGHSPPPRWELLRHQDYLFTNTVTISRGCPWKCSFCYNSATNIDGRYRLKPRARILQEIDSLNTDHVMFIDDNFAGNPREVRKLLPSLKQRGLTWHAAASADIGRHPEFVAEMADAGCKSLFIGFETVNSRGLLRCRKTQNRVDAYDETIALLHSHGIMVNASLVFGFDTDDESVFPETLAWLVRNRVSTMTAHILTPYPGTVFHQELEREDRIIDRDLDHYNTAHVVFEPRGMSATALAEGYRRMYRQFYSWQNILRRWPAAPGLQTAYLQFNLVYRKYGKLAWRFGQVLGMRRVADLARRIAYPRARPCSSAPLPAPTPAYTVGD